MSGDSKDSGEKAVRQRVRQERWQRAEMKGVREQKARGNRSER